MSCKPSVGLDRQQDMAHAGSCRACTWQDVLGKNGKPRVSAMAPDKHVLGDIKKQYNTASYEPPQRFERLSHRMALTYVLD